MNKITTTKWQLRHKNVLAATFIAQPYKPNKQNKYGTKTKQKQK